MTCGGLCFLRPGSQSYKWQFPRFKSTRLQSDARVHFRFFTICSTQLEPKLYLLKVTNQPGFPRNEGVPRMWDFLVLKLGNRQSNQDVLVSLLSALPVAVCLFFHSFGDVNGLYLFPYPPVSSSPSLAFRPLSLVHETAWSLQVSQAPQFDTICLLLCYCRGFCP